MPLTFLVLGAFLPPCDHIMSIEDVPSRVVRQINLQGRNDVITGPWLGHRLAVLYATTQVAHVFNGYQTVTHTTSL